MCWFRIIIPFKFLLVIQTDNYLVNFVLGFFDETNTFLSKKVSG